MRARNRRTIFWLIVTQPGSIRVRDEIRRRLLAFYDRTRRDLAWRKGADPYRVWISEVMLQQTRVDTVMPYFERWMERFPTLEALAQSEREDVLRAWAGLGYYARARNLHRTARIVSGQLGGKLPVRAAALRHLPGIGEYTAGAIASIAFGQVEPAVDGNARRVLTRLFDLRGSNAGELRRRAAGLLPLERPGDFNQALMELGRAICTPRAPACPACPLLDLCRSRARGNQDRRPAAHPRARRRAGVPRFRIGTAVVVSPGGRVLLARRPESGLLAGMWEFPGAIAAGRESPRAAARRALRAAVGSVPVGFGSPRRPFARIPHAYSHRHHEYHAFRLHLAGEPAPSPLPSDGASRRASPGIAGWTATAWAEPADLGAFPLPRAQRRIAEAAFAGAASRGARAERRSAEQGSLPDGSTSAPGRPGRPRHANPVAG
ncbi:MAG TPA: A/G-specific adenine glycosylase [Gemmatimonadota bacterium]|nr:A/G-specific adenine glycosylase [Gemmatimonadota bacterium]